MHIVVLNYIKCALTNNLLDRVCCVLIESFTRQVFKLEFSPTRSCCKNYTDLTKLAMLSLSDGRHVLTQLIVFLSLGEISDPFHSVK